jgi:formylglycine-generating enzyme required for sulfatase activity
MAGNVWEWVADWYGPDEPLPGVTPRGTKGVGRVIRGGAWTSSFASDLRGTRRAGVWPTNRDDYLGFRCALP